MPLRLVDRFTTQDGEWFFNSARRYGITSAMLSKYRHLASLWGGATHVYVKAPKGVLVTIVTEDGQHRHTEYIGARGYAEMPLYKGSAYNPDRGERGPWKVLVNGEQVADGIGLPFSWHVSTFVVVDEAIDVPAPKPQPAPPIPPATGRQYIEVVIRTMRDGIQLGEQVVWRS